MSAPHWATERFRHRYGPWAVVTGASSGIGRETALALSRGGIDVVLVARRELELDEAAALIRAEGRQARVLVTDLADGAGIDRVVDGTRDLDVGLMVSAAGFGGLGAFLDGDDAVDRRMTDVNITATAALARAFGGRFAARGRGGLVLVGSIVARQGVPLQAHYAATKAYVHSLAEALAVELRPAGVDVLLVAPGPVDSGFAAAAGMRLGSAVSAREVPDPILTALGRRRVVVPGRQARVLTFGLSTMPRPLRTRIMHGVMRGFVDDRDRPAADHVAAG